ncbi:hypothetical protein J5N97_016273 [Dioscorea zingiberensis]|uniref:Uncharacterized protein n=1 Tax=Dioscorea zingiberensis TaxID=325984 RepID=A0A9D5CJ23_9LILI|nr:hypothetical protein J5N97_016273 [Dioscorea zingiberensis]
MANKDECKDIWSLGLGILASMICSLGDDSSCINIVDGVIHYFSEKSYLISGSLSSLKLPADDHGKKRTRIQKAQTSLVALRETEQTLALICVLARYQASWSKGMQSVESDLRETAVHILAFISKVGQRPGDSPYKTSFYCPPSLKEEFDINGRPSFINVKSGWFKSTVSCLDKSEVFSTKNSGLAMMVKDQGNESANKFHQTQFSDMVAIQIYRIAFLLLKFLCMQAKAAAKRAEEVEFIDLARFPELPMPEILHGLQDQAIAIVTEIFETNKSKPMHSEAEGACLLLLQILEKCLYLELCVSQSCGIRPVSGRVEDFSKEFKRLLQVAEPHPHFKAFLRSLSQMIALVYPGIL